MSDFDFINFLMIDDVGRSTKNNEHLQDLRDRAASLAKKTGVEPTSWYDFKENTPKEENHTLRNALIGAVIGGAVGAVLGMFVIAANPAAPIMLGLSCAFMGGAAGGFSNTENTRRDTLVKKYESYLDNFEASVGRGVAKGSEITYRDDHAKQLADKKAFEQQMMMAQGAGMMTK